MTHGCTDPTTSQQLNHIHINKILRPCDLAAQQKTLRLCSHRVQGAWRDIPRAWVSRSPAAAGACWFDQFLDPIPYRYRGAPQYVGDAQLYIVRCAMPPELSFQTQQ